MMQIIDFIASEVEFNEALDGDIVEVSFDEGSDQGVFDRTKCCVSISQNYEFSGAATVEWHDGEDYNGGSEVLSYRFTNDLFELITTDEVKFSVTHDCRKETYTKIEEFLQREFGYNSVTSS
ncbi:MAG: hypothetical protein Q9M31_03140 [Mariprofundus sp.]|nr:hypothetical protein [Mariprofundus sp.]